MVTSIQNDDRGPIVIVIYKFIRFYYYEFTRKGESKWTLTFSYYFRIGRPEQFHQKSSDSKVQRFQVTYW